jgi:hypothetical protein
MVAAFKNLCRLLELSTRPIGHWPDRNVEGVQRIEKFQLGSRVLSLCGFQQTQINHESGAEVILALQDYFELVVAGAISFFCAQAPRLSTPAATATTMTF